MGQIQLQTNTFQFVQEECAEEFLDSFMTAYERLVTTAVPWQTEAQEIPTPDEVWDNMNDFFYGTVSWYEFDGDSAAYMELMTEESMERFYATANNDYAPEFYEDMLLLAQQKHICLYTLNHLNEYMNLPMKEVW